MAKTASNRRKKKTTSRGRTPTAINAAGKQLVIVESPAKAKTINQYLGPDYVVAASVGHVRDLPAKAEKGSKQPVPGVDLENDFEPTYTVLPEKKKTVAALKKAAKEAKDIWFATDLDREGEAIAWHLAQELGVDPSKAKRVIFNAITRSQIEQAFENPHTIDLYKVNAQQARRVLDRIVGYQVSPLLWKKVARGLSAGRVQSVAVRLVVERERDIREFVPDESWRVTARLCLDADSSAKLRDAWRTFIDTLDEKGRAPTVRAQNGWLGEHEAIRAELVEIDGSKFELGCRADAPRDLSGEATRVAAAVGMRNVHVESVDNPDGKGPARTTRRITGDVDVGARYAVTSVQTKRTSSKPPAPFITSTLQASAANTLGLAAQRTMRIAQGLYEGVQIKGEGQIGLITYMRTDSTHLSGESIDAVRSYIGEVFGDAYLPDKPNRFGKSKSAQEAHEAIRPADVRRRPDELARHLTDDQLKLYRLIWNRFVACQMTPAQWNSTSVLLARRDKETGAVLKASGRVLVFDGFYRVTSVPSSADEQLLPDLSSDQLLGLFSNEPEQLFSSPAPRFSEASLVKALEAEGIGRPSTYASIIQVIQDRNYVEQLDRRFHATDLGEVVTRKLVEAFPKVMDIGYTRWMESELDAVEEQHHDWVDFLHKFYEPFKRNLDAAHEQLTHAKAETQPAIYKCPQCSSQTCYRFGKNGRFLSCSAYPECDYAAPIDREGRPQLPEHVDVACPEDGSQMIVRTGRFGRFLASVNYPEVKCVVNLDKAGCIKYPSPPAWRTDLLCPKCDEPLNLRRGKRGPWLGCSTFPKCRGRLAWTTLDEQAQQRLTDELEAHEKQHPQSIIRTLDGEVIPEGTPVADLIIPGGLAELEIHPSAEPPRAKTE